MVENLPLIIDRVRFAKKLSWNKYLDARKMFQELKGLKLTEGTIKYNSGDYTARLHYGLGKNKGIAAVSVFALENKTCSIIFDLWPHRITGIRFQEFQNSITSILDFEEFNYNDVFTHGHVQKVEYAFDILNRPMHSFIAWTPRARFSEVYKEEVMCEYKGQVRLGSFRSPIRFSIYNKSLKLEKDGMPNPYPIRTRLEAIVFEPYRPGSLVQRMRPSQLDQLPNPFRFLEIADFNTARKLSLDPDWQYFLDLSAYGGAPGAFQEMDKKERLQARKMLRMSAATWWNPAYAWEGHQQANSAIHPQYLQV